MFDRDADRLRSLASANYWQRRAVDVPLEGSCLLAVAEPISTYVVRCEVCGDVTPFEARSDERRTNGRVP